MGFCNCFLFCCALLYFHSSFAIILMGRRELVALLCLSSWCLVIVVWLFFTFSQVCLQFVSVVFPDHTHLLFLDFLWAMDLNACKSIILNGGVFFFLRQFGETSIKHVLFIEQSTEFTAYKCLFQIKVWPFCRKLTQ